MWEKTCVISTVFPLCSVWACFWLPPGSLTCKQYLRCFCNWARLPEYWYTKISLNIPVPLYLKWLRIWSVSSAWHKPPPGLYPCSPPPYFIRWIAENSVVPPSLVKAASELQTLCLQGLEKSSQIDTLLIECCAGQQPGLICHDLPLIISRNWTWGVEEKKKKTQNPFDTTTKLQTNWRLIYHHDTLLNCTPNID